MQAIELEFGERITRARREQSQPLTSLPHLHARVRIERRRLKRALFDLPANDQRPKCLVGLLPVGDRCPDMGGVSPNGKVLWLAGRYTGSVYAISTTNGHVLATFQSHGPNNVSPGGIAELDEGGFQSIAQASDAWLIREPSFECITRRAEPDLCDHVRRSRAAAALLGAVDFAVSQVVDSSTDNLIVAEVQGHWGHYLSLETHDGRHTIAAVFFRNDRLYEIEASAPASDFEAVSSDLVRFQQSLRFIGSLRSRRLVAPPTEGFLQNFGSRVLGPDGTHR